jgi:hypothetical protein
MLIYISFVIKSNKSNKSKLSLYFIILSTPENIHYYNFVQQIQKTFHSF